MTPCPGFLVPCPQAPLHNTTTSSLYISLVFACHSTMLLGLPERLPGLVEAKFRAAQATKSLIFSSTELAIIRTTAGVPVRK